MSRPTTHCEREVLVPVLVYHQRMDDTGCACGWRELGESHAEHIADVYEMAVQHRDDQ